MNKTLVKQVQSILRDIPQARNSDITLMTELWRRYYPEYIFTESDIDCIALVNLFNLPREDNIKRIRAKIQNEERRFLPTEPMVFVERAKLSREWKKFLGYKINKNPDYLTDKDYLEYIKDYLNPSQQSLI